MVKEYANSVQKKPSLSLLYDPVGHNGPIWSVQQGLEEVSKTVKAESEKRRLSPCRLNIMHMSFFLF